MGMEIDIVHTFFQRYSEVATDEDLKTLDDSALPMAASIHLLKTREGTKALTKFTGFWSAKQRKAFITICKGQWWSMSSNEINFIFVMRMLATVDDTVLVKKKNWEEMFESTSAQKVLASILTSVDSPILRKILAPDEITTLKMNAPGSLKDPEARRKENVT